MGEKFDFINRLQARTAMLAIGRSTLRNQGAPGVVMAARKYLRAVDLKDFSVANRAEFSAKLNKHTKRLMKQYPDGAKDNWGAARKAMNIFLRDVLYSRPLCNHYGLSRLEGWLELPLDRDAYEGLVEDSKANDDLPAWPGIRALDASVSARLQGVATKIARRYGTKPVHLDVK